MKATIKIFYFLFIVLQSNSLFAQRLTFKVNKIERMTILPSGKVGVNTKTPDKSLVLVGLNPIENAELYIKQTKGSNLGAYITFDNTLNNASSWSIGSTGWLNSPARPGLLEIYQLGYGTRMLFDGEKVGINLGNGIMPTAVLHSKGSVRLESIPTGDGWPLLIDENGYLYKATDLKNDNTNANIVELKNEILQLKNEIDFLKAIVKEHLNSQHTSSKK